MSNVKSKLLDLEYLDNVYQDPVGQKPTENVDQVETGGVRSEIGEFAFLKLTVCERLKRKYEVGNMIFWAP